MASGDATSIHVLRAQGGDATSLGWLVERYSPLLLAQARYRLGGALRAVCEPEDLVHDVWTIALPRLPELVPRSGGRAQAVLGFLSTTLFLRLRGLVRRHVHRRPVDAASSGLVAPDSGVLTRCIRAERVGALSAAIDRLAPAERSLLVLRGIEQCSYAEIAAVLGGAPKSLAVAYGRLLGRLRRMMPGSVFDEFEAGTAETASELENRQP